jgi:hypothetical protein
MVLSQLIFKFVKVVDPVEVPFVTDLFTLRLKGLNSMFKLPVAITTYI